MKTIFQLLYHIIGACITLMLPSRAKALVAENLNLKQQLTVLARKHSRAPSEIIQIQNFKWKSYCNGIFQLPIAA